MSPLRAGASFVLCGTNSSQMYNPCIYLGQYRKMRK